MLTEATRKTRTIGYFLERSFLLDERGFHFFLFSFHGESLTIFEKRERDYLGIFSWMAFVVLE